VAGTEKPLPRYPLISGLYHVVPLDADRVEVCNAGRSFVLRGERFSEKVMPLLDALDGTKTVDELAGSFPELVPALLEGLSRRGVLVDAAPPDEEDTSPYSLTAAAVADALSPAEIRQRLGAATVVFVGCAPVLAEAALHLAKARVNRLVLIDGGLVTAHDVTVSPGLDARAEGRPRVDVVRALCGRDSREGVEIATLDGGDGGVAGSDGSFAPRGDVAFEDAMASANLVVIEARPQGEAWAPKEADLALSKGIPYLLFSQDALEAFVGPAVSLGGEPCHRCADMRRQGHVDNLDEFLAYRRHRAETSPLPDAFLSAHTSFLGGLLATEALRAVLGIPGLAQSGVVVVDLAEMKLEREEVLPVPGCEGCESAPSRFDDEFEG
jgi:bacteriocin biosynthesis cyclodehydratase domain-containing protein